MMSSDLPAALLLERPCRPCQDDQHDRCLHPFPDPVLLVDDFESMMGSGCCCDDLDRNCDPDPPRWHP